MASQSSPRLQDPRLRTPPVGACVRAAGPLGSDAPRPPLGADPRPRWHRRRPMAGWGRPRPSGVGLDAQTTLLMTAEEMAQVRREILARQAAAAPDPSQEDLGYLLEPVDPDLQDTSRSCWPAPSPTAPGLATAASNVTFFDQERLIATLQGMEPIPPDPKRPGAATPLTPVKNTLTVGQGRQPAAHAPAAHRAPGVPRPRPSHPALGRSPLPAGPRWPLSLEPLPGGAFGQWPRRASLARLITFLCLSALAILVMATLFACGPREVSTVPASQAHPQGALILDLDTPSPSPDAAATPPESTAGPTPVIGPSPTPAPPTPPQEPPGTPPPPTPAPTPGEATPSPTPDLTPTPAEVPPCPLAEIDGGEGFSIALSACGVVLTWGSMGDGGVGQGDEQERLTPTVISDLTDITRIAAGESHAIALDGQGRVFTWGEGSAGQLGHGQTEGVDRPTQVAALSGRRVIAIAAGRAHSLALDSDGALWAWGEGLAGQLGNGQQGTIPSPRRIAPPSDGVAFADVAAGADHSLAVDRQGRVWAWGYNSYGQLGLGDAALRLAPTALEAFGEGPIVRIAAGAEHSLALDQEGTAWAWGRGDAGQLGLDVGGSQTRPSPIVGLAGVRLARLGGGDSHSFAVDAAGTLWVWGGNERGQLGQGDLSPERLPIPVAALAGAHVTAAGMGSRHSLAADDEGHAYAWGDNDHGQLGDGRVSDKSRLVPVALPSAQASLRAGSSTCFAIDGGGLAWSWGPKSIALGRSGGSLPAPIDEPLPGGLVETAAGHYHGLALTGDGAVWSWGSDSHGQLGHGAQPHGSAPQQIASLAGIEAVAVSAGDDASAALDAAGHLWMWGENNSGQLGQGDQADRAAPTLVSALLSQDLRGVSTSGNHTLAVDRDGNLFAWGNNSYGQLGLGHKDDVHLPTRVRTDASVRFVAVAAGLRHSLALDAQGGLWSWGSNSDGQLGGPGDETPQRVEALAGVAITAISAGGSHSAALAADGTLWTWGNNNDGQLGQGHKTDVKVPTVVAEPYAPRFIAASLGEVHSLFLTAGGEAFASGRDDQGQLGDAEALLPIQIL